MEIETDIYWDSSQLVKTQYKGFDLQKQKRPVYYGIIPTPHERNQGNVIPLSL